MIPRFIAHCRVRWMVNSIGVDTSSADVSTEYAENQA